MTLPEFTEKIIEKEMQRLIDRVPMHARKQVRLEYEIEGLKVTLFECRANWQEPDNLDMWSKMPLAQFRYTKDSNWSLYWMNSKEKWLSCDWLKPQNNFAKLVDEVENDSHGTFWG